MRTIFALILKFVAFILAFFAIFATIFALLFLSFNRILLAPQTYKQAFIENKVYEKLPEVTATEFALIKGHLVEPCMEAIIADSCIDSVVNSPTVETGKLGMEGSNLIQVLHQEQWNGLVFYLLTPDAVQRSLDAGVNEVIAYFKGETASAGIPLSDVKEELASIRGNELATIFLNQQPSCTLEQQTRIMSGALDEIGSTAVFCSATGGTSDLLLLDLQRRSNSIASELPEQVVLLKPPSPSNPAGLQRIIGKDLQATLQAIQINAQYIPVLPGVLLLLVTIINVRSLRGLLRWWSLPVFIGSLVALIVGVILFFLFQQMWLNYVLSDSSPILTSGFGDILYSTTHSLARNFSQHLMTQAGIATLITLSVLLISNRLPAPPDPSLPPLAPPGTPGGPVLNPNQKKKKW
ncbi:MAG TPA: hypothetical protein VFQ23_11800 [Anaerolineales bacterium]|nr:hypothetical protein [Anaerolineales bacterium]